jgi:hypothetical protein
LNRRILLLICVSLFLPLSAACDDDPPARQCGLIADATSFAKHTDVEAKVKENVPRFLSDCVSVAVAVVTGSVAQSPCRHPPIQLLATTKDNPNDSPVRADQINQARKAEAISVMNDLMECAKNEPKPKGSDVIGAILDVRLKGSTVGSPVHMLIISDMANRTEELDLYKADISSTNIRQAIFSKLKRNSRLPELADSTVQIIGFGLKVTSQKLRQEQFLQFWQEFFTTSGSRQPTFL